MLRGKNSFQLFSQQQRNCPLFSFLIANSEISHLFHPILDRSAAQADAVAAVAAAVAANNKFIAADEVHKLIITSRQRISPPRVPVQTITDDLQHNGARLTDAGLLARLFARTRGLMRLRHRLHAYGYPPPAARYNLDSEGAHGFLHARNPKTQPSSSFAQERILRSGTILSTRRKIEYLYASRKKSIKLLRSVYYMMLYSLL